MALFLMWRPFVIISDVSCVCYIFNIIRRNGGRGKLLFLFERLERADMIIWISELSTRCARMCAIISDQPQFYPNVTFQENQTLLRHVLTAKSQLCKGMSLSENKPLRRVIQNSWSSSLFYAWQCHSSYSINKRVNIDLGYF